LYRLSSRDTVDTDTPNTQAISVIVLPARQLTSNTRR
jgi:hypothetical protein